MERSLGSDPEVPVILSDFVGQLAYTGLQFFFGYEGFDSGAAVWSGLV